jgi:thioredoxin-like negative regulator of GroEL
MSDSAVPDFFNRFAMRKVTSAELDAVLAESDAAPLTILVLWGRDCPNCDIAKRALLTRQESYSWPAVRWLHDNVYDDEAMAHRFGLHGIPVFFVFRGARKIGRITSWPGPEAFVEAIDKQIADLSA